MANYIKEKITATNTDALDVRVSGSVIRYVSRSCLRAEVSTTSVPAVPVSHSATTPPYCL